GGHFLLRPDRHRRWFVVEGNQRQITKRIEASGDHDGRSDDDGRQRRRHVAGIAAAASSLRDPPESSCLAGRGRTRCQLVTTKRHKNTKEKPTALYFLCL